MDQQGSDGERSSCSFQQHPVVLSAFRGDVIFSKSGSSGLFQVADILATVSEVNAAAVVSGTSQEGGGAETEEDSVEGSVEVFEAFGEVECGRCGEDGEGANTTEISFSC